jgi:hypothetical protein
MAARRRQDRHRVRFRTSKKYKGLRPSSQQQSDPQFKAILQSAQYVALYGGGSRAFGSVLPDILVKQVATKHGPFQKGLYASPILWLGWFTIRG